MIRLLLILVISPSTLADETTVAPSLDPRSYVNCGHAERLLQVDSTQYVVGGILAACWRRGVTLDELDNGILETTDLREDIELYRDFAELRVPCEDVFSANLTRLTTSLLEDYLGCEASGALSENSKDQIDERFGEILRVYSDGNASVTVDRSTLVPCANASQRITLLCREFGLTGAQWSRGFLAYEHREKWAREEEIAELSLGCDRAFEARLHEDAYEADFLGAFVRCEASLGVESEVRDGIEKNHADELIAYRGGLSIDLRGYVSCRHLIPVSVRNGAFSASWYAYDQCRSKGLTYEQLCNGTSARDELDEVPSAEVDVRGMYVKCESVFNEELWSFTTGLIKDYQACEEVGEVDEPSRAMLRKKFAKLFELLATKRPKSSLKTIAEDLIPCSGLSDTLADECRRHGSTLAQELRGIGSLALILGDKWLNTEPLDKLYIRCEDVFNKYVTHLDDVPLEKFVQCRWKDGLSEDAVTYIDTRISQEYRNDWKSNDTRFIGDADVEISSTILFTEQHTPLEQAE